MHLQRADRLTSHEDVLREHPGRLAEILRDERTLRDEEVEEYHSRLTARLLDTFGAEQR